MSLLLLCENGKQYSCQGSLWGWLLDTFEQNGAPILSHCIGLSPLSACLALISFLPHS